MQKQKLVNEILHGQMNINDKTYLVGCELQTHVIFLGKERHIQSLHFDIKKSLIFQSVSRCPMWHQYLK
jgi:hypothetical protein